jgi:hypothetical protein
VRTACFPDGGGDENDQIYLRSLKVSGERLLTDGKSLNGQPAWAHDGKRMASSATCAMAPATTSMWSIHRPPTLPRLLVAARRLTGGEDWSLDDNKLLLLRAMCR